jgi:signal transduction histidine kinase/ActR/RegA family two-component response regulator
MPSSHDNRSYLVWVSLTTLLLTVGLAVTAAISLRQSDSVEAAARLQADSVTALTFQAEREFLRFRNELRLALTSPHSGNWDAVQMRFDIFASRVTLLRDNPSMTKLRGRPEYNATLPELIALVEHVDVWLADPTAHHASLNRLLERMIEMGPDVQSLSFAANSEVTHLMDQQVDVVRQQHRMIGWLVIVQLLVIAAATASLFNRHRRLQREQMALEHLNRQLLKAKDAAEAADRAKTHFLANMSHELRTPFNGMLGMMDMLNESSLDTAQREQLQMARQSAEHLLLLLNDILDLSAIEAGKLKIRPEPCEVPALLTKVCELLQVEAARKGLALSLDLQTGPPQTVMVDPTRLRQILLNLIGNAVKFTTEGHVAVELHEANDNGQIRWTIAVSDTGPGMDERTQSHLFQRFHQLDESASRQHGGSGLGLEISRNLARLMGGDIQVQSQPALGSCFTVSLTTPVCADDIEMSSPGTVAPEAHPVISMGRLRILVAEDHPVNRQLVGMLLDKLGHEAIFAVNGREAVERLQSSDGISLVLMDLHMPEMDGLEAARRIRQRDGPTGRVPIIALTADLLEDTRHQALASGINEYLLKPVQKASLLAVIHRWGYPSATHSMPS